MSGLIKYRVHEVAKDFNMTSKEITQILTDYATTPKNHMQVLEDAELNDIFEYLTQHHQAASLEELYKVPDQPKAKPQAAPAEAPKSGAAQQPAGKSKIKKEPAPAAQPSRGGGTYSAGLSGVSTYRSGAHLTHVFYPVSCGHRGAGYSEGGASVRSCAADDGGYVSIREEHQNVKRVNGEFWLTAFAAEREFPVGNF